MNDNVKNMVAELISRKNIMKAATPEGLRDLIIEKSNYDDEVSSATRELVDRLWSAENMIKFYQRDRFPIESCYDNQDIQKYIMQPRTEEHYTSKIVSESYEVKDHPESYPNKTLGS